MMSSAVLTPPRIILTISGAVMSSPFFFLFPDGMPENGRFAYTSQALKGDYTERTCRCVYNAMPFLAQSSAREARMCGRYGAATLGI